MRILHTTLRYPPASGGAETYVRDIVEHTRANNEDRDVRVLTSKLRTHGPPSELDPELLLDDPPYIQRLHHARTPLVSYPRLQALSYYIGHHQPDILHTYGFWYQPADVTARYARRHHIPLIFHPIYYENDIRQKPMWQLYQHTIGRQTFAAADIVAVISSYERELIVKAGFPVKRFELIPPGIDVDKIKQPKSNPYTARGLTGRILLTVGRLAASKGLDDAITALAAVRRNFSDTHLVIIGEDFGEQETLKQHATRQGLASRVHFWNHVDRRTLVGAYQHADLLVFPSRYEAFGIVAAEALAAGIPVVGRQATAIPFVVPHEHAGLLFVTADEFAQHILTLLANDSLRRQYGAAGQQYIKANFAWPQIIKKLVGLYQELNQQAKKQKTIHEHAP